MAIVDTELTGVNASIEVSSGAFGYNEPIPPQYTQTGMACRRRSSGAACR